MESKKWDIGDIQVLDPEDWVKKNKHVFFREEPTGHEIMAFLMSDMVILGHDISAKKMGEWWVIWSDHDWLKNSFRNVQDTFRSVTPFPEKGINALRAEIIAYAFSENVSTYDGSRWEVIRGCDMPDSHKEMLEDVSVRRLIAFVLKKDA